MSNRITEVRARLREALVGGVITDERAHAYPQTGEFPTPCAWLGITSLRGDRSGITVTIPAVVVIDGDRADQWPALDDEAARLWDALRKVQVADYVFADVTAASPRAFGPEGSTTRGVELTVTATLAVRTLCDEALRA